MAEARALSSAELEEVPDWLREQMESYNIQYGAGNSSTWNAYQRWLDKRGQPKVEQEPLQEGFVRPRTTRTSPGKLESKRTKAYLAETETNLRRRMDLHEARAQASRKVDYWTTVDRDSTGAPIDIAGAGVTRMSLMDPGSALLEAFKPQTIQTSEAAEKQKKLEDERKTRAIGVRGQLRGRAVKYVRGTQPGLGPEERAKAIDAAEGWMRDKHLTKSRELFYEESFELASRIMAKEQNKTVIPPGKKGYEEQDEDVKREHFKLGAGIATQMIRLYETEVFPELAKEREGGKSITFEIPGYGRVADFEYDEDGLFDRSLKTLGDVGRSLMAQPERGEDYGIVDAAMLAARNAEAMIPFVLTGGDAAVFDLPPVQEDGRIVETPVATAIRDIGGIIRLATSPAMQAISFEVDANGNPIDPDDMNYKLYVAQEQALKDLAAGEGSLADYYLENLGQLPLSMSRVAGDERPRMDTGSWVRDAAIEIAQGRMLGDDFMELQATTKFYEDIGWPNAPKWLGLAVEIALPISPLPLVRPPVRAALTGFAGGTKVGSETIARFMNRFSVPGAETITRIGESTSKGFHNINHPVQWAEHRILANANRRIQQGLPVEAARVADTSLPGVMAERYAGEFVSAVLADAKLGFKQGTPLGRIADETAAILTRLDRALEVSTALTRGVEGAALSRGTDILKSDPQGLEILDEIAVLAAAGMKPTDPMLKTTVAQNIIKRRFDTYFANAIPNQYRVIAANVIMTEDKWQKVKGSFHEELKSTATTTIDKATGEQTFLNPEKAAALFDDGVGASKAQEVPKFAEIKEKILAGKALDVEEYGIAFDSMKRGLARNLAGSVAIRAEGPAIRRAEGKTIQRGGVLGEDTDLMGYARMRPIEDLYRAAQTFFKDVPSPAMPKFTDRTARPVTEMLRKTHAEMIEVERILTKKLHDFRVEHGADGLNEYLKTISSDDVISDLEGIMRLFFGDSLAEMPPSTFRTILENSGRFKKAGVTRESIRDAIHVLRVNEQRTISGKGLGKRFIPVVSHVSTFLRSSSKGEVLRDLMGPGFKAKYVEMFDAPDAAVFAWALNMEKKAISAKHIEKFTETHPEFLFRLGGTDQMDMELFRKLAPGHGVPVDLIEPLGRIVFGSNRAAGALNASDFKGILNQVIGDLFQKGGITPDFSQRVADAVMSTVSARIMRTGALRQVIRREAMRIVRSRLGDVKVLSPADTAKMEAEVAKATQAVLDKVIPAILESATHMNLDRIVGQLSAMGLPIPVVKSALKFETLFRPQILHLEGNYGLMASSGAHSSAELKMYTQLLDEGVASTIKQNMELLAARDANILPWMWHAVTSLFQVSRRGAIGGLLGGFPLLGTRFAGLNVLSAPFITAITAPSYVATAIKTMPRAAASVLKPVGQALEVTAKKYAPSRKAYNWFEGRFTRNPGDVAVVGVDGKVWTHAAIQAEIAKNNVRFSQASFEYQDVVLSDMRRAAATNPQLFDVGMLNQTWRWMNPTNKSVWNIFAEESDMAFREAVFVEALRRGHTSREAATLAQNTLLDYGAIPSVERQWLARHMWFYAFLRQMAMEVIKTLMRDGTSAQLLAGQLRFIKAQHEEAGTWATEPDYARHRLWAQMGKAYDGVATAHYGLAVPGVESFNMLANVFFAGADFLSAAPPGGRPIETMRLTSPEVVRSIMKETLATPTVQLALEIAASGTHPERFGKDWTRVPHQFVVAAQGAGMWDLFRSTFEVADKLVGDRVAGEPVYEAGEVQYEFSKNGARNFRFFTTLLTYAGIVRNLKDNTDVLIRAGVYPEDTVLKRRGDGNFILYSVSLDTVMPVPSEYALQVKIAEQIDRELSAILKGTSPIED